MTEAASESTRRWTYSSARTGLIDRAVEAYYLLVSSGNAEERARLAIDTVETMRRRVRRAYGVELRGMRMLDIGPGQQLRHMRCFSSDNEVVGIDMDVILQDLNLTDSIEMLRRNSITRVAKTLTRKAIGVDRDFSGALARRLGMKGFDKLDVRRMDAAKMMFPDSHFDFAYTYSVFEHIDQPEAALAEVRRVLAPGGIAYISLHLYTSHSGQHDPKMLVQNEPEAPFWPHLRPQYEHTVSPSAYLNKVRFGQWKEMFAELMPGAIFAHEKHEQLTRPLAQLRSSGELRNYDDDELLTVNFVAMWRKPKGSWRRDRSD